MINCPDVYYLKKWGIANEKKDDGIWEYFLYKSDLGEVYYPFIKRKIDEKIDCNEYYDIITPYGFNGPIIISNNCKKLENLVNDYNVKFNEYCKKNNIVSEYVRFSPWLKNHIFFKDIYDIKYNNTTLFIDLTKDFFYEEFSSKCRNVIRKSIKNNVEVDFDFEGNTIEEFSLLYNKMAKKNNVNDFYKFDLEFLRELFNMMYGNIVIVNAKYNGKCISSAMFLYCEEFIHYHLSGNDYEYTNLGANSLILSKVAEWAKKRNIKQFHLGGASRESLFKFKKQFTKNGVLDYFVGSKIRNEKVYNELVKKHSNNTGFFPKYR